MEPRRADFAAWYLVESGAIPLGRLRAPQRVSYRDLALVHDPEYLESLSSPETLAAIFALTPGEVPVEELLLTVRLACGGTVEAARAALLRRGPTLNLLGGFHHAAPTHGGGFCPVNDIAVAISVLRREGFSGQVAVIDLDAHPPDGTAECLRQDPASWIGSLSGSSWGELPGIDEVVLPEGIGDGAYLEELSALLRRMPRPALAFVIAGGDVLARDTLGRLGLSLDGARRRDLQVAAALRGIPSVWLPGGGYHPEAWKVLAGTGLALAAGLRGAIPARYDPLRARFSVIAGRLSPKELGAELELDLSELEAQLGGRPPRVQRFLGFYSAEGWSTRSSATASLASSSGSATRASASSSPKTPPARACGSSAPREGASTSSSSACSIAPSSAASSCST
jgi:acetoin utilization deacetylase AcuC-like enzyme